MLITPASFASYFFECTAEIKVTSTAQDEMISLTVLSTKECGTHLQAGETKRVRFTSKLKQKPQAGGKHQVIYRYFAPECMQKEGKPVDCHRETIEFVR